VQGNFFSIKQIDSNTYHRVNEYVKNRIQYFADEGKHCFVKVEEYNNPRSLSANALYWYGWMTWLNYLIKKA